MARLKRRSPLRQLQNLEEEMEDLFSSSFPGVFRKGNGEENLRSSRWTPEVDIFEENDQIIVECECPGLERDDIDVSLEDNILSITGKREREEEIDEENYYRSERHFDSFERSFRLPSKIDADAVDATYVDGILKITLPVTESQERKKVEID